MDKVRIVFNNHYSATTEMNVEFLNENNVDVFQTVLYEDWEFRAMPFTAEAYKTTVEDAIARYKNSYSTTINGQQSNTLEEKRAPEVNFRIDTENNVGRIIDITLYY